MDFLNDSNLYMDLINRQINGMKDGDSRHIEIDDRFNAFMQCNGNGKYTGWFYYVHGAFPAMTFENLDLKEIVALAYNDGIFSKFTEGEMYNTEMTNKIREEIAFDSDDSGIISTYKPEMVHVNSTPDPSATAEVIGDTIYIKITKSLHELIRNTIPDVSDYQILCVANELLKGISKKETHKNIINRMIDILGDKNV